MLGIFKKGRMRTKKVLKLFVIALIFIFMLKYLKSKYILNNPSVIKRNNIETKTGLSNTNGWSETIKSALYLSLLNNGVHGKLITLFVTFADVSGESSNEGESYRRLAQMNFLQTSNFPELKAKVNFVIYTDCSFWLEVIDAKYPHVYTLPPILRAPFKVPLLKDMAMGVMERFNSPFYMYANADNIYDTTLVQTVSTILKVMQFGLLKSKILVIGHRFNVKPNKIIQDEKEVAQLKQIAQPNKPFAKDYTIFTIDSFDWVSFPDLMIARQFLDSYMVDYAFHNEIQIIDGTATISLVHQVKELGYSTGKNIYCIIRCKIC